MLDDWDIFLSIFHIDHGFTPGFPGGLEVKASAWNAGDPGSIPGLGRSPGEGKWQPTPVLLPGESPGGRSLVGYSPWGCRVGHDWVTSLSLSLFQRPQALRSQGWMGPRCCDGYRLLRVCLNFPSGICSQSHAIVYLLFLISGAFLLKSCNIYRPQCWFNQVSISVINCL